MIKFIFNFITNKWIFNNINKNIFNFIFNNLRTVLMLLPISKIWNLFLDLIWNRVLDIPILNIITSSSKLESSKLLYDTPLKKIILSSFIFTILSYRWYVILKKTLLWPFKLGIFSFIFSVIGLDVKWFLNIFDFFTFNVPYWVYFQYITLYNNWLNWWYNSVNIKSIQSPNVIKTYKKELGDLSKSELNLEKEDVLKDQKNNLKWYILGVIVVCGVIVSLYYFDLLNYPKSGGGAPSKPGNEFISNQELIQINRNDNSPKIINSQQFNTPAYVEQSSSTPNNPLPDQSNPWDNNSRSPSPTGSTDSDKTIMGNNPENFRLNILKTITRRD
jgi:hypothetical protein